jgi:hypothetical protein
MRPERTLEDSLLRVSLDQTLRIWLISKVASRHEAQSENLFMPSTHLSLHFHIVFSTKDRHPFIADVWRERLHEYLGGLVRAADGVPEAVGGTADHVHLLVGLRATHTLAAFVQDIKQTSSRWIHETIGIKNFACSRVMGPLR